MSDRTKRSRYPEPGTDSMMVWDDGRPAEPVVVLATSRHRRKVSREDAMPLLEQMWAGWGDDHRADLSTAETVTWRSVRVPDLGEIEASPGDWSTEGSGSAWVLVLRCDPIGGRQ